MKALPLFGVLALMAVGSPAAADQQTVVFLHNAWYEKNKGGEAHKTFGVYDFTGINQALAQGAKLIAPERGPDAKPNAAAADLVALIKSLMAEGVNASDIKVVGASKGAYIAQLASAEIKEPELRWVLVGGCHVARMTDGPTPKMSGRVLSIYEVSDKVAGPCAKHPDLSKQAASFEERAVETGKGHGFQFSVDRAWIDPAVAW